MRAWREYRLAPLRVGLTASLILGFAAPLAAAPNETGSPGSGGPKAASPASEAGDANLENGAAIARRGTPAGAAACIGCHGPSGEGNAAAGFPRLAGLPADYLAKELSDYTQGLRASPIMQPLAQKLTAAQMAAVARYYAGLGEAHRQAETISGSRAALTAPQAERARELMIYGDERARIPGCTNCHGAVGLGEAPSIPPLAGQNARYIEATLHSWQDGSRHNDAAGQMASVAHALAPADTKLLAAYLQGLPPPSQGSP